MPITQNARADNGIVVAYHKPVRLEVDLVKDLAIITVNSHSDEAASVAGLPIAWQWRVNVPVEMLAGDQPTWADEIEHFLVTDAGSPFAGGAVVADMGETLETAKARVWERIKRDRQAAEEAPFEFEGGLYDPNKENIAGAALAALLAQLSGAEVSRTWTLSDNTLITLTGPQLIGMGLALTNRVDAIHERGRILRNLIDHATTPAEAYGYTWSSLNA